MKNFLFSLAVFAVLAFANGATAGRLTASPEWSRFHWLHSSPVAVSLVISDPEQNNSGHANTAEIMRRLQLRGLDGMRADNLLFGAFNELYECPYIDYYQSKSDIFPRDVQIILAREFDPRENPHSFAIVADLKATGLKHNEAQSLYFSALDEHLGCLLEP